MRRTAVPLALLAFPAPAWAGMPAVTLSDVAATRIETLSFFLVVFFLLALAVKGIWNGLRKDFPKLPRLTYKSALGVLAVWGLLFMVVLTMISGARELLTPGAWEKRPGEHTYTLTREAPPPQRVPDMIEREQNLVDLKAALWNYAASHDGQLPPDALAPEVPSKLWQLSLSQVRYVYLPGRRVGEGPVPVVCEPDVYEGDRRFVLLATGEIRPMTLEAIQAAKADRKP